jgi:hypothetical protein
MTRRLLPLGAACVLAFSACGGDSDEEASGSATPAATKTTAAAGNDFCDKTKGKTALAKLPASGTLRAHPELVSNPPVTKASKAVTDYWFEACG